MKTTNARKILAVCLTIALTLLSPFICLAAPVGEYTVTAENISVKYDGSIHTFDFKLVDEEGKEVTEGVTWSYEFTFTGTEWYTESGSLTMKDAGKMYVKATAEKDSVEIVSEVYSFEVTRREVTITSASDEKKYDGTALKRTDPACDVTVSGDGFVAGETYSITFKNSSVTYTGSVENEFDCTFNGLAKEQNYVIEKVFGTLTVIPTDAYIITADSASKEYDGTALTAEGYTESGQLCGTDTLVSARTVGTITEVGTAENKIEATITNGSGEDVTNCYTLVNGTLTIYPNAVYDVKEAISQIGTVTYTQACREKIDAAREAYEALTKAQKERVTNYSVLTDAEAAYGKLILEVDNVILTIDEIGTVEYTSACKAKIDAARAAYEALTETQKADVTNYAVLTAAEAEYERLERNNKNSGNSVETGDIDNPVMYVMIMLVALGGIISVITINKKRRD